MSWIIHCVSLDIKNSATFLDIVAVMWAELTNRFSQGKEPRLFELNESRSDLCQGDDSVTTYFTKIRAIWDEINELLPHIPCSCQASVDNLKFQNQEKVLQFLIGLKELYHDVHDQVLILESFPSLSKVFATIIQHERQCKIRTLSKPPRNKQIRPFCAHCEKPENLTEKYYILHRFPLVMVTNGKLILHNVLTGSQPVL
ncbi:uncharacterized protein LOC115713586 [Cannabis sativa]|uniref:uncharacterized protein LOC115713586 n=1 Tax=Cannabis sativa TaxID=3483 RepID=UPI0011DF46A4|nr:uncharacterized protein LOC115713586 [Cannabis sativa]